MPWVRASYGNDIEQVDTSKIFLSTLTFVCTVSKYNLFRMDNGNMDIIIFSDQRKLLKYVMDNEGAIFALRLLKPGNNKYQYLVPTSVGDIFACTLASALVLLSKVDRPRTLTSDSSGKVVIE